MKDLPIFGFKALIYALFVVELIIWWLSTLHATTPPTELEPERAGGKLLPSWEESDANNSHFNTALWPEALVVMSEVAWMETLLNETSFPTKEARQSIETALCATFARWNEEFMSVNQWGEDEVGERVSTVPSMDAIPKTVPREEIPEPGRPVNKSKVQLKIDLSKRTLDVYHGRKRVKRFSNIEWSRVGVGTKIGSLRTPTGNFTLTKEPYHRYGPVLRLSGYQGMSRGILIHRDNTRDGGSNGCIHVGNSSTMKQLFDMTPVGAGLEIRK